MSMQESWKVVKKLELPDYIYDCIEVTSFDVSRKTQVFVSPSIRKNQYVHVYEVTILKLI